MDGSGWPGWVRMDGGSGWMGQDGWVRMAGMGMGQGGWVRMDGGQDGWVEMGRDRWVRPPTVPFTVRVASCSSYPEETASGSRFPSTELEAAVVPDDLHGRE